MGRSCCLRNLPYHRTCQATIQLGSSRLEQSRTGSLGRRGRDDTGFVAIGILLGSALFHIGSASVTTFLKDSISRCAGVPTFLSARSTRTPARMAPTIRRISEPRAATFWTSTHLKVNSGTRKVNAALVIRTLFLDQPVASAIMPNQRSQQRLSPAYTAYTAPPRLFNRSSELCASPLHSNRLAKRFKL